ncbi:MAG TPA: MmgE/PrpD family protein [Actinomycetota bacterium]|nr:MmgE/PrpD family protein [Actinomycetota bacterium]
MVARLAGFVAEADIPDDLPVDDRILDTLGVALGALRLDTSQAAVAHSTEMGGAPQATAIGIRDRLPAPNAAFVNGVLAHSLDYDDTHLPSVLHPSASVVPAALAGAELAGASGAGLRAAVGAGLEVCVRLGMAGYDAQARNSTYFDRGQHATSMCGAIAGAAAAARLLGLDADGIGHAMGIAVSMASGVIEGNRTGGTVKRLHCGWAAQSAVTAAMLASRGFTGPASALEGRFGFFQAFLSGRFDGDAVVEGLGSRWEARRIFVKPYPANHFTHAGIDAALALRERGLRPERVQWIELGVAGPTVRTIGEPIESKRAPATGYQAQFSGPYTVASALVGGSGLGLGLDDFSDELCREPVRQELAAKVSVVADEWAGAIFPEQFPAVLRVRTTDGDELVERVEHNRGGPQRPLSPDELRRKFRDNALRVLPPDAIEGIEEAVTNGADAAAILAPATEAKGE